MTEMDRKNASSIRKLSAAGIGVPLGVVTIWAFELVSGITAPGEVAAAWGAMLVWIASVLIPDHKEG